MEKITKQMIENMKSGDTLKGESLSDDAKIIIMDDAKKIKDRQFEIKTNRNIIATSKMGDYIITEIILKKI